MVNPRTFLCAGCRGLRAVEEPYYRQQHSGWQATAYTTLLSRRGSVQLSSMAMVSKRSSLRWCGLVLCLVVGSLGVPSAGAVAGYGDVGGGRYFAKAVQWSADKGITGIDGACFGPDAPVSRGEVAVYLWNLMGRPDAAPHSFTDATLEYQDDAISWMLESGITTGTSATTFSPEATLTRGQAAALLHRLVDEPAAASHAFVDVFRTWQQAPVSWMTAAGITTGTSTTTFSPDQPLTRAQAVTFLYRFQGEPDVEVVPDSPACCGVGNGASADPSHCDLATELSRLEQTARDWDSSAQVRIAVILSDGSAHGVGADERMSSASSVKPLWTAAAIDAAGLEAVVPLSHRTIALSNNYTAGEVIDLAGGIDEVNRWVRDVAGLPDTDLAVWSFGRKRVSNLVLGNRTTMSDLALFYARLHRYRLLDKAETDRLTGWLRQTPRRLSYADGALVDRLPSAVSESVAHKTGWLPPGWPANNSPLVIDGGLVHLPNGEWFALALSNSDARHFDRSIRWLGFAACRIYVVVSNDLEHDCEREGDPAS